MKKKGWKNNLKKNRKWILVFALILVSICGYLSLSRNDLKASTVVTSGDFRLTAENKWSQEDRKNYAALDWDKIADLSQSGYQLYQSEDGVNWSNRSLNYGKAIKVLNVYPDDPNSAKLKEWMDQLDLKASDGSNLIQVTPVTLTNYNGAPDKYLKNSAGEYQYDVVMFGSWDGNNRLDINATAAQATKVFIETGRGVLFGHDTVITIRTVFYSYFKDLIGIGNRKETVGETGSTQVKLINNGYLMKYPFEMENNLVLNIPYAHNYELQKKNVGTTWLEFINPSGKWPNPIFDDGTWRSGWYLKTNNNVGMIQTGHSGGESTVDERKIIANTLYNLAQVSSENFASDQTVKDDKAPDIPKANLYCGKDDTDLKVKVGTDDNGKEYQWYIEANTKSSGKKKSDVVKETIISNVAGYFYEVTDSATSSLQKTVEGYKDSYGRIDPAKYSLYVAPNSDSLEYETRGTFTIPEKQNSEKYLHILAVDRSNNVSQVNSLRIKDLVQVVDFKVERTADEAKLIDLNLDTSLNNTMGSLEIITPSNTVIKDFSSLGLPAKWTAQEGSATAGNKSFIFTIKDKNDLATIENFINSLRFSISDPVNQKGEIKVVFYEQDKNAAAVNEASKVCWTEDIPQKISLKAYDESNNPLTTGDLLLDQKLTLDKKESITPKVIDLYDFIKLVSDEGTQILPPLTWTVTSEFQQGQLIYGLRKLTVHGRQVVVNKNDQTVLPKKGFGLLESNTVLGQKKDEISLTTLSTEDNTAAFDTYIIRYQMKEPLYTFSPKIPMNYQLVGYVLTMSQQQHLPESSVKTPVQIDVSANPEFWLTTYIEPVTEQPTLYHWEYKENKLGEINP